MIICAMDPGSSLTDGDVLARNSQPAWPEQQATSLTSFRQWDIIGLNRKDKYEKNNQTRMAARRIQKAGAFGQSR